MGSTCDITTFTDNTGSSDSLDVTCTVPTNPSNSDKAIAVAGDHLPKVHFAGLGFAIDDVSLTATTIEPVIGLDTNIVASD